MAGWKYQVESAGGRSVREEEAGKVEYGHEGIARSFSPSQEQLRTLWRWYRLFLEEDRQPGLLEQIPGHAPEWRTIDVSVDITSGRLSSKAGEKARKVYVRPLPSPKPNLAQAPTFFFFRVFFRVHCGSKGANTEFIILFPVFQFAVQFASFLHPERQDGNKKEYGRERA